MTAPILAGIIAAVLVWARDKWHGRRRSSVVVAAPINPPPAPLNPPPPGPAPDEYPTRSYTPPVFVVTRGDFRC